MDKIKEIGKAIIDNAGVRLAFKGLLVAVAGVVIGALGITIAPETIGSLLSFLG